MLAICVVIVDSPRPPEVRTSAAGPARPRLSRYLSRPVATSPRYLDHGVIMAAIGGGVPHLYRLSLGIGLLDHVSLGASATWSPGATAPVWTPEVGVAFWRGRSFDAGVHYRQTLHRPPPLDDDPATPAFEQRTHWFLGSASVSAWWVSAGADLGVVRRREIDPVAGGSEDLDRPFVVRHRLGGGLHVRLGTRRFGFTAQARWPTVEAELLFDVRFGAFEMRPRGGWRVSRGPRVAPSSY